ncbi:SMC-Scp complex subunit ScpB [Candidatus Micrarchaeota archaeon]|nr:SMC-Scp complex subunit ScpB [Candidatus Micrarchaeota archaeon]
MDEKMDKLAVLESVLFMSPKPVSMRIIMKSVDVHNSNKIKKMIDKLNKMYEDRGSAVRVFEVNNKYILNILPQYADYVTRFTTETELTKSEMKVLAYIAKNNGILKSKLIKRIGVVYDKVKSLEEKGFIKEVPDGRSSKLFLTKKFKDYFGEIENSEL